MRVRFTAMAAATVTSLIQGRWTGAPEPKTSLRLEKAHAHGGRLFLKKLRKPGPAAGPKACPAPDGGPACHGADATTPSTAISR